MLLKSVPFHDVCNSGQAKNALPALSSPEREAMLTSRQLVRHHLEGSETMS